MMFTDGGIPVFVIQSIMTTYDPGTDTFGHATTLVGSPFSPFGGDWKDYDKALVMLTEARKRHGMLNE